MSNDIVIAYGDSNALRRGVAHAVLRDVLLHGPLDLEGPDLSADLADWIDRFAAMRGSWLSDAFGVPADQAGKHIASALHAVTAAGDHAVEVVVDERPCVDCALAIRLISAIASCAGIELRVSTRGDGWNNVEADRDQATIGMRELLVGALTTTAAAGGTLGDAWRRILEADAVYGIADLGACYEFMNLIRTADVDVRVEDPNYGGNFVLACAHSDMDSVILHSA